ncbi:hypothetical protein MKX01_018025 [Papaver californicum]|nr:hypothetical protein MKX01_018025 [Papaver californicum]
MFNALSGMGGGGQVDHTAVNNANTALYTTFAVFGILGGGIYYILGPRYTLFAGCSTYVLDAAFAIVAGGILGLGAGLLWAGQGAIMTSYPPQHRKGTYIAIFWSIFNMGGVIGELSDEAVSVNDGTYIGFMFFMAIGTVLTLGILPPSRVVRDDGSRCTNIKYSKVTTEVIEILKLFLNWKMLLLVPASLASNFFYSYQFNNVLGSTNFREQKKRGFIEIGVVALLSTSIWAGGLANQLTYSSEDLPEKLDFKISGSGYAGPFVLYFSYGLLDAMFQSMIYWVIGALADDSETLSRYVGFYKGIQSAGGAAAWQTDVHGVSLLGQLIINWSLTTISYPLLVLLVMLALKKKNEVEDGETKGCALTSSSLSNGNEGNEK